MEKKKSRKGAKRQTRTCQCPPPSQHLTTKQRRVVRRGCPPCPGRQQAWHPTGSGAKVSFQHPTKCIFKPQHEARNPAFDWDRRFFSSSDRLRLPSLFRSREPSFLPGTRDCWRSSSVCLDYVWLGLPFSGVAAAR